MQRSAWRPTCVGQHVGAPVVEQHEVELLRPVALAARRSTARCRGSSARRSRSAAAAGGTPPGRASAGSTFSMPMTVTSTSGSVVHIRPLPSDSTTHTVPVSATPKFAPLTPMRASRNLRRRCSRATAVSSAGLVGQVGGAQLAAEQVADLGPVAVDGGDEDVRGRSSVELDDQLGQVGLHRRDALGRKRVVELDLVGGDRLDLHHLVAPVLLGAPPPPPRWPRRRRGPSAPGRRPRAPTPRARSSSSGSRASASSLIARPASRSSSQSGDLRDHPRPACRGWSGWRGRGCAAAGCRPAPRARLRGSLRSRLRIILGRGEDLRQVHGAGPGALAAQAAADVHQARVVGRGDHLRAGVAARRAACRSASPSRRRGSSPRTSRRSRSTPRPRAARAGRGPRTARSSRNGRVAHAQAAQRVAGRVVGHPVRVVGAHVLDPQRAGQELAQLPGALGQRRGRRARAPSRRTTRSARRPPRSPRTPRASRCAQRRRLER